MDKFIIYGRTPSLIIALLMIILIISYLNSSSVADCLNCPSKISGVYIIQLFYGDGGEERGGGGRWEKENKMKIQEELLEI